MARSEQLAAIFGAVASLIPLLLIGWRTLTLPHDSPFWPVLIPLSLLILLAVMTPIARQAKMRFWRVAQSLVFIASLAAGLGAVGMILAASWSAVQGPMEEPGLALMLFMAVFVPACTYVYCVLTIDQSKFNGRVRAARWFVLGAALLPLVLFGALLIMEVVMEVVV